MAVVLNVTAFTSKYIITNFCPKSKYYFIDFLGIFWYNKIMEYLVILIYTLIALIFFMAYLPVIFYTNMPISLAILFSLFWPVTIIFALLFCLVEFIFDL